MLKYYFMFFLPIIFTNCTKNDLYNIVKDKYSKCTNKKEKCIIDFDKDLEELIKESWDKIYILNGDYPREIDSLIGIDESLFSESMPKILFVKDKKVVYQEGYDPNIGQDRKGILLDYNLTPYLVINRKKSKFQILPMTKDEIHYTKNALYIKYCKNCSVSLNL